MRWGMGECAMADLAEAIRIHARKVRLSHLYDSDKLPFKSQPINFRCKCGAAAEYVEPYEYNGKTYGGNWIPVQAIDMDDGNPPMCRRCFCREYYVLHHRLGRMAGTPHPAIPASEREYNGGSFYSAEW
jgi:hypothetical protein